MGKLQAFKVMFDQPQGVFLAGQVLSGNLSISLAQPMKMRSLTLTINGLGKVHWKERRGKRTIHYRQHEPYLSYKFFFFGSPESNESQEHPAGSHTYPFSLLLGPHVPSSFEGGFGHVRYIATATIDKPWKFNHSTKVAFTVLRHLDLNYEQIALLSAMEGSHNSAISCCCCVSGRASATFRIDRRGYVPGETIIINAQVQNNSNTEIKGTSVILKQIQVFIGVSETLFSTSIPTSKFINNVVATLKNGKIPAGESQCWDGVPLRIPPLPPSRLDGCSIVNISYVIEFHVYVSYGSDIVLTSDLTIGTIPMRMAYHSSQGVVSQQPIASVPLSEYAAPPGAWNDAPPSYEVATQQPVNILEEGDSQHTMGSHQFTPAYPYFEVYSAAPNQL